LHVFVWGLREKELQYLTVGQLDFNDNTLKVEPNPKFNFEPKDWEERSLPLPEETMLGLLEITEGKPKDALVFPTQSGRPNHKLLKLCKRLAKSAGLVPARFYLHKFRATFASTLLRRGMNLRDVQYMLGHKDLKSTMRYLANSKNQDLRKQIETIWTQQDPVSLAEPGAAIIAKQEAESHAVFDATYLTQEAPDLEPNTFVVVHDGGGDVLCARTSAPMTLEEAQKLAAQASGPPGKAEVWSAHLDEASRQVTLILRVYAEGCTPQLNKWEQLAKESLDRRARAKK
jgi:hypothetical protein